MRFGDQGSYNRPHVAAAGAGDLDCQSLVLSEDYEDKIDDGDECTYIEFGGGDLSENKRTALQSFDQLLTKGNDAIVRNCNAKFDDKKGADAGDNWKKGKPIRVVRGYKGKKHSNYAPEEGCRYIKTFLFV